MTVGSYLSGPVYWRVKYTYLPETNAECSLGLEGRREQG